MYLRLLMKENGFSWQFESDVEGKSYTELITQNWIP